MIYINVSSLYCNNFPDSFSVLGCLNCDEVGLFVPGVPELLFVLYFPVPWLLRAVVVD